MTERIIEQPKKHTKRNAGIGATMVLGLALVGASCSSNTETKPTNSPSNGATLQLATQRPSEAGASPMGSSTPEASNSPEVQIQNFTVEKLGTFDVLPGDIIAGDVSMSDSKDSSILPLYDQDTHKAADVTDNTKTALYVEVQTPGVVHAEWGATVTRGLTAEQKAEMLKLQTISKSRAGFDKVDVVVWTGFNSTTDEAGFKSDGTEGSTPSVPSANPSESPMPGANLDGANKQELINTILEEIHKGNLTQDQEYNLMQQLIACLCSCGTPSETPKPTPTPTPEVCVPMNDHFMKKGEIFKVNGKEFIVQGDVFIDGKQYFDSGKPGTEKTGAIDIVLDGKTHTIRAPYGADVQVFNACAEDQTIKNTYNHDLEQLKASGRTLDKKSLKRN